MEFNSVDIGGGVVLDGWIVKPSNFDGARKYPVIVFVYGEPANQTVLDRWGGVACSSIGRLPKPVTSSCRSTIAALRLQKARNGARLFTDQSETCHRKNRPPRSGRLLQGTRLSTRSHRRVGMERGGSNTFNAMFRFPDLYKVGVAVAPVPDQQLYDTIYQERYMGLPKDNAEGYRSGSSINFAAELKGKLLLVHGTGDDNVHFQGTERLIDRLIELGKPFDVMVYPNRTHAIAEGPGTTPHVHQLIARYFLENLPPGGVSSATARP